MKLRFVPSKIIDSEDRKKFDIILKDALNMQNFDLGKLNKRFSNYPLIFNGRWTHVSLNCLQIILNTFLIVEDGLSCENINLIYNLVKDQETFYAKLMDDFIYSNLVILTLSRTQISLLSSTDPLESKYIQIGKGISNDFQVKSRLKFHYYDVIKINHANVKISLLEFLAKSISDNFITLNVSKDLLLKLIKDEGVKHKEVANLLRYNLIYHDNHNYEKKIVTNTEIKNYESGNENKSLSYLFIYYDNYLGYTKSTNEREINLSNTNLPARLTDKVFVNYSNSALSNKIILSKSKYLNSQKNNIIIVNKQNKKIIKYITKSTIKKNERKNYWMNAKMNNLKTANVNPALAKSQYYNINKPKHNFSVQKPQKAYKNYLVFQSYSNRYLKKVGKLFSDKILEDDSNFDRMTNFQKSLLYSKRSLLNYKFQKEIGRKLEKNKICDAAGSNMTGHLINQNVLKLNKLTKQHNIFEQNQQSESDVSCKDNNENILIEYRKLLKDDIYNKESFDNALFESVDDIIDDESVGKSVEIDIVSSDKMGFNCEKYLKQSTLCNFEFDILESTVYNGLDQFDELLILQCEIVEMKSLCLYVNQYFLSEICKQNSLNKLCFTGTGVEQDRLTEIFVKCRKNLKESKNLQEVFSSIIFTDDRNGYFFCIPINIKIESVEATEELFLNHNRINEVIKDYENYSSKFNFNCLEVKQCRSELFGLENYTNLLKNNNLEVPLGKSVSSEYDKFTSVNLSDSVILEKYAQGKEKSSSFGFYDKSNFENESSKNAITYCGKNGSYKNTNVSKLYFNNTLKEYVPSKNSEFIKLVDLINELNYELEPKTDKDYTNVEINTPNQNSSLWNRIKDRKYFRKNLKSQICNKLYYNKRNKKLIGRNQSVKLNEVNDNDIQMKNFVNEQSSKSKKSFKKYLKLNRPNLKVVNKKSKSELSKSTNNVVLKVKPLISLPKTSDLSQKIYCDSSTGCSSDFDETYYSSECQNINLTKDENCEILFSNRGKDKSFTFTSFESSLSEIIKIFNN